MVEGGRGFVKRFSTNGNEWGGQLEKSKAFLHFYHKNLYILHAE